MKKIILAAAVISIFWGCRATKVLPKANIEEVECYAFDTLPLYSVEEGKWWQLFGDTTLDNLIEEALSQNKPLYQTLQSVEQARLSAKNSRAEMFPDISVGGKIAPSFTKATSTVWSYGLTGNVSWSLDLFGKLRNSSNSSIAEYIATEWGARGVKLALISEVATTYFSLSAYQKSSEVAQNSYNTRIESLRLIDSMYNYGAVSLVDLEQARSLAEAAKSALFTYQNSYNQSLIELNLLLGRPFEKIEVCDIFKANFDMEIGTGAPSILLERRPDVMEKFWNFQSALYSIKSARAERFPSITLSFSGGLGSQFKEKISSAWLWNSALSLLQPLYEWGTLKRNEEIAISSAKSAASAYEEAYLSAISDVDKSLSAIETGKKRVNSLERQMKSTASYKYLTNQLYLQGMSSYLNVLDADRSLLEIQTTYISSLQTLLASYIELYAALGGTYNNSLVNP